MADVGLLSAPPIDHVARGLAALLERLPNRPSSLAILTYHRVAPAEERPDLHPGLRVDPDAFAAQLQVLCDRAQPVSLADLQRAHREGTPLPPRAVHVTIDDAYACVEHHAWPALRAAGVPATLFVPTAYPDTDLTFWWDRLHHAIAATDRPSVAGQGFHWATDTAAARSTTFATLRRRVSALPHDEGMALVDSVVASAEVAPARPAVTSWAALRRMGSEGLALAPHSRTHPRLDRISADRLDGEVAGSWDDLRRELGPAACPAFALPGGGGGAEVREAVRRAGLDVVVTTDRGVNRGAIDWLGLRRINVGTRTRAGLVRIQLCPEAHAVRAGAAAARTRASVRHAAHGG